MGLAPLANFWLYQIAVRGLWNFSLFFLHPLAVVIGAGIVLEIPDYNFFLLTGESRDFYDRTDKVFDALFYTAAAVYYTYFWHQLWYAKYIAPLLYYRILGNIVFLVTLGSWVPLVFPNLGEALMLVYSALDYGFPGPHPGRRFDRFFRTHKGWNWLLIASTVTIKWIAEFVLWFGGNDKMLPPQCVSVAACWSIIAWSLIFFVFFAVLATYWRMPHFDEGTVRRSAAGVPVKQRQEKGEYTTVTVTYGDYIRRNVKNF